MSLADNKCIPCRGGVPPLPAERMQALLTELGRGWALSKEGKKRDHIPSIRKRFFFLAVSVISLAWVRFMAIGFSQSTAFPPLRQSSVCSW